MTAVVLQATGDPIPVHKALTLRVLPEATRSEPNATLTAR